MGRRSPAESGHNEHEPSGDAGPRGRLSRSPTPTAGVVALVLGALASSTATSAPARAVEPARSQQWPICGWYARAKDIDEEGAIKSQRRPIRRDAVDMAESAVASTWVMVACGLRRRAVRASSCTSKRATGRATAISSHRRSLHDNKAHISGPVGVSEYQSVAPSLCGHSYTLDSLRAMRVCCRRSHVGRGPGAQLVQGSRLKVAAQRRRVGPPARHSTQRRPRPFRLFL